MFPLIASNRMPRRDLRYPPIEDYAAIGDCASIALVSRDASIDWLCWPRFDSPSVFGALLDREQGGFFRIAPTGRFESRRRYAEDTNVLETTFETAGGVLRVTDLMPVAPYEAYEEELWPDTQLLRVAECLAGEVELEVVCEPRLDYGRRRPDFTDRGALGLFYTHGAHVLVLRSEVPLRVAPDHGGAHGRATLRAGDRCAVSLTYDFAEPAVLPLLGDHAATQVERSISYWRAWSGHCAYEGPYREAVVRSALALKLLTFSASGAVVAAATTSLPEEIGGERNWDYRFCWLRDASFTMRAFFELGYGAEASAFFHWLVHTTRRTAPEVCVLYDIYGRQPGAGWEANHLEGYRGSRPVRIGNAAKDQLQLDTYGELVAGIFEFARRGGSLDRWQERLLLGLGRTICERWNEPDQGIWEIRGEPRHHTHSKALCWVGLDRIVQLQEADLLEGPEDDFRETRERIAREVFAHGYSERLGYFTSAYDVDTVDASLLLLPLYGFVKPTDPRMARTFSQIEEHLGQRGLLHRYRIAETDDGLSGGEGAFGICSFWAAEYLAERGDADAACRRFEQVALFANDLGLFAEEIDPETGAALGNYPQAYTHVGLINAALSIAEATGRRDGTDVREDVAATVGQPASEDAR